MSEPLNPEHYSPMTKRQVGAYAEAISDTLDTLAPDVARRIGIAIDSGLYSVLEAGPEGMTLDVHGFGELTVRAVPLPRRADA